MRPVAEELDREKRFLYEIVAKLGELGLMGIPEEYGGGGPTTQLRDRDRGARAGGLERGDHRGGPHLLGTWPLYAFGSDELKAEWMPRLCSASGSARSGSPSPRPAPTRATPARAPSSTATTG